MLFAVKFTAITGLTSVPSLKRCKGRYVPHNFSSTNSVESLDTGYVHLIDIVDFNAFGFAILDHIF